MAFFPCIFIWGQENIFSWFQYVASLHWSLSRLSPKHQNLKKKNKIKTHLTLQNCPIPCHANSQLKEYNKCLKLQFLAEYCAIKVGLQLNKCKLSRYCNHTFIWCCRRRLYLYVLLLKWFPNKSVLYYWHWIWHTFSLIAKLTKSYFGKIVISN